MSPQRLCTIILLITSTFIEKSQQKRDYRFTIATCDLTSADSQLSETNCTISRKDGIDQATSYLNVFQYSETYGILMEISLKPPGRNYFTMLNMTIDNICPYLGGKARGNLVMLMIDEMSKVGKFSKCPLEKDLYYVKDFNLSPEYFPPYMPEAGYRIRGGFFGTFNGVQKYFEKFIITGNIESKNKKKDMN